MTYRPLQNYWNDKANSFEDIFCGQKVNMIRQIRISAFIFWNLHLDVFCVLVADHTTVRWLLQ